MTEIVIEVKSTLEWSATQSASSRKWIAECEALGLSMEGDSLDELHSLIPEACFALFVDLLEDDELDRFLMERGWHAMNMPAGPVNDDIEFSIPWNLVAQGAARDSERRTH
jgi:hypothetical protein